MCLDKNSELWNRLLTGGYVTEQEIVRCSPDLLALATMDSATNILNKTGLAAHFKKQWEESAFKRIRKCLLFIDINRLKIYNEISRKAGDAIIYAVASAIKDISECEVIGRMGGDEFVISCPSDNSIYIIDQIDAVLLQRTPYGQPSYSISIGVVFLNFYDQTIQVGGRKEIESHAFEEIKAPHLLNPNVFNDPEILTTLYDLVDLYIKKQKGR